MKAVNSWTSYVNHKLRNTSNAPKLDEWLTLYFLSEIFQLCLSSAVIDGEGYTMGGAPRGQQVTAMETSSGGGIMRGGIYHPSAAPGITDPQVSNSGSVKVNWESYFTPQNINMKVS